MPTISQQERERLLQQVELLISELQRLRAQLAAEPSRGVSSVANLFGRLGKGSWREYDDCLDWERFAL